jgi:hypothetical protein
MYIVHIMNLKINIWIPNFLFEYDILNLNPKFSISIQKTLIDYKNGHFNFEYFNMNMKIHISTLKILYLNLK